MTDKELLNLAADRYATGDLCAAMELYAAVIQRDPRNAEALYMSGWVAFREGDFSKARDLFRQAVSVTPKRAEYHNALGLASMELGDYAEAESSILRAIRLSSRPEFHNSLGTVWKRQGRLTEAIRSYRHAIKQDDRFAEAYYNLGNCYHLAGQFENAVQNYRRAAKEDPGAPAPLIALGEVLRSLGKIAEAIQTLEAASQLAPDADVACAIGDLYQDAGRLVEAVAAYQRALSLDPGSAGTWYALGCAELSRDEFVESSKCFSEALVRQPEWFQAEHNLARALFQMGRVDEALVHFRRCADSGDEAVAALARAMMALIIPEAPSADNASVLACRRRWAATDLPDAVPQRPHGAHFAVRARPLRIGYISSFFHRHNWMKPVWGLINEYDRSKFEIHLFSAAPASRVQLGYRSDPRDRFFDISLMPNDELARFIQGLEIDILVDLSSYSDMRRISVLALRPAAVIVAWFNLYATSGIDAVDYLIGDHHVIPAAEEAYYTERIRRISGSYLTFSVDYPVPPVADPPCLSRRSITFGSFASQIKVTAPVIEAWSRILQRSQGSSLFLKNGALGSLANREFVYDLFAKEGITRERLRLEGPAEHYEFLRAYDEIDIALDTFPYNGGTTTTEAIWQGVPVVAYWGDRWLSRTSASILWSGGLDEFVRGDLEDYISFAAGLATQPGTPGYLAELRRGMRSSLQSSAVCDAKSLARQIEAIYEEVYNECVGCPV
jgi:predicted O-linked N-acetylglucosamine transferase (SPINDLY family)